MNRRGFLATIAAALGTKCLIQSRSRRTFGPLKYGPRVRKLTIEESTRLRQRLAILQRQKAGLHVSPWEIAEAFDVPGFGCKGS